MSDVLETIKSRRSIRKYKSDMIPQDRLEKIIEAGTYAATGMGKQSPIIIAVTNKELRDKLSAMNAKIMGVEIDPFYGAPVVLIVLADRESEAAGSTEPKKNSRVKKAKNSSDLLESRAITKESDTASLATQTVMHQRLPQEKIPMFIT